MCKPGYPFEAQINNNGEVMVMKRFLASLLCAILVVSTSITVFGATKNDVQEKINSSVAYAFDGYYGKGGYDETETKQLYYQAFSGADISRYTDKYFSDIQDMINSGAFTGLDKLGLALNIMYFTNTDPSDFNGVNLLKLFENTSVDEYGGNAYYLQYASNAAAYYGLDDFAKKICDKMLEFYTMGSGTDFWGGYGTSVDDLATFVLTLAPYNAVYQEYINDAFALIEQYYTENGYDNYGANANSTALALAAYSAVGNKEKADSVYNILINNFFDESTGGFKSDYDEYYATSDAVYGMSFYINIADENSSKPSTESGESTTNSSSDNKTNSSESTDKNTSKTSPNTGNGGAVFSALTAMAFAGAAVIYLTKKHN